jgi:Zn-dependent protease
MDQSKLLYFAAALPAIIIALSLHEFGHAAMATKLGDPTPRMQGRLTLNPLAHLDPLGTIFIIMTLIFGFGFGWGKPVMTNPAYFSNYRRGIMLVKAAGPAMNLCQAMLALGTCYLLYLAHVQLGLYLTILLGAYITINIVLMVFNLVPVEPLDGAGILHMLLPYEHEKAYQRYAPYGFLILLAMMWLGVFSVIIRVFFAIFFYLLQLGFGQGFVNYLFPGFA